MANDIVTKAPALPPALVSKIAEGLRRSHIGATGSMKGQTLLRLIGGAWLFGQGNDKVQTGSAWWVHIGTFKHGYVCWHESRIVDESMTEMWHDAPVPPATVHASGQPYKPQVSMELKCLDGEDAGQQLLYKISSMGGTEAVFKLKELVSARLDADKDNPFMFPVIELNVDSYPNRTHGGTTYKPQFDLVGWADINGELEDGEPIEAEAETEEEPKPPKPAAKAAKPALRAVKAEEPTAPAGQRRRPGR